MFEVYKIWTRRRALIDISGHKKELMRKSVKTASLDATYE